MSEALIGALVALIDSRIAAHAAAAPAQNYAPTNAGQNVVGVPVQQAAHDPFGGLGGAPVQQAQQNVTPEMIQSLIVPLVSNEQTKARLAAEMSAMGLHNLGDAQPAQLPELYTRFQRVAQEAQGQQQGQQQAASVGGGII